MPPNPCDEWSVMFVHAMKQVKRVTVSVVTFLSCDHDVIMQIKCLKMPTGVKFLFVELLL